MILFLRIITVLILSFSFYACSVNERTVKPESPEPPQTGTQDIELEIPSGSIAKEYIELALQTTGVERNEHLLKAAQILIQEDQLDLAERQINTINTNLISYEDTIELRLLKAEIALGRHNARAALHHLNTIQTLPDSQQIRLMRLRANAFLMAEYPLESAKTRIQMDQLLSDSIDLALNHQAIWEALSRLPATSLQQISNAPLNKSLRGWIELAKIAKRGQVDWQFLQDGFIAWQQKHPNHPAAKTFIQILGNQQVELIDRPEHIVILLPLTGQYAKIASAIREGIMSAYYQHPDKTFKPEISFINTVNHQVNIDNLYKQAEDLGADFIIGPFLKPAVDRISHAIQTNVPTLTLNYASSDFLENPNLFQFGLLPEDEARQAADMAFRQAHTHAAVLVPNSNWGERIKNAFQMRFEELGGTVVSTQAYNSNKNDFKQPIQYMLNINQSYNRYRAAQKVVRSKMKFTPYRRQDVDMIFMAATPKDARQLKPQFRFHYAGEIPVYSTSHVFTGRINKQADRDIDNLNFLDMPWILNPPTKAKQALIRYWPRQQRYTRFFALGVDAYNLIPFLGRLQNKNYERFSGQTGNLYLDKNNRIHRELLSAQFKRGIPTLIDINTQPVTLVTDETQPIQ